MIGFERVVTLYSPRLLFRTSSGSSRRPLLSAGSAGTTLSLTSASVSARTSPAASPSTSTPANETRWSEATSEPSAATMRFTWWKSPSRSVRRQEVGEEMTREAGRSPVPSGSVRPAATRSAASGGSGRAGGSVTRYTFSARDVGKSSSDYSPPSLVSRMAPVVSRSRRPTGESPGGRGELGEQRGVEVVGERAHAAGGLVGDVEQGRRRRERGGGGGDRDGL